MFLKYFIGFKISYRSTDKGGVTAERMCTITIIEKFDKKTIMETLKKTKNTAEIKELVKSVRRNNRALLIEVESLCELNGCTENCSVGSVNQSPETDADILF